MNVKFIGITGGSDAGKSTLCNALKSKYPDKIQVIQLDDYFKSSDQKPKIGNITNSDHPDSLYIDQLVEDLLKLKKGEAVMINTKNQILNPNYPQTKEKIPILFESKPIIIVEGFLVLCDERIRNLLSTSIFLDTEHKTRWSRRYAYTNKNAEYEKLVIIPMHNQFVEPTKKFADHIIDVSIINKEEVLGKVEGILFG